MSKALWSPASAADSSASVTGMGTAVPSRARALTRAGCRAAASSTTREPMEWPTSWAVSISSASSARITQSAMSAMASKGGPAERPWPGRSRASTLRPWWAK